MLSNCNLKHRRKQPEKKKRCYCLSTFQSSIYEMQIMVMILSNRDTEFTPIRLKRGSEIVLDNEGRKDLELLEKEKSVGK